MNWEWIKSKFQSIKNWYGSGDLSNPSPIIKLDCNAKLFPEVKGIWMLVSKSQQLRRLDASGVNCII